MAHFDPAGSPGVGSREFVRIMWLLKNSYAPEPAEIRLRQDAL